MKYLHRPKEKISFNRREFLRSVGVGAGALSIAGLSGCAGLATRRARRTDVRVVEVGLSFENLVYRAPVKFAGAIMDNATIAKVRCTVCTADGRVGHGVASMPFNHIFAYPSKTMTNAAKNDAMKALAEEIVRVTGTNGFSGHPLELNWQLAPLYLKAAEEVSQRLRLPDPIPRLCTLVTCNAFDTAIYDAYGKLHGVSSFRTLGPEFLNRDLSEFLGPEFKGRYPADFLLREPKPRMPLCHLISAVDPIEAFENARPIKDGLPETLSEWIDYNGLLEFKIKLNGDDLRWDVERVLHIDRVTTATQQKRGVKEWGYVLDFNEKCPNVEYFIKCLEELRAKMPVGFRRIKYVEQPTSRDLKAHSENRMHAAAKLCPVVIDESVVDVASVLLARELGWSGAVLKSSKGLSNTILIACAAAKRGIFVCGGDMSCPGLALIQTANFQARVPGITAIEANARQYLPQGNSGWERQFPGIFKVTDGLMRTSELNGKGMGAA